MHYKPHWTNSNDNGSSSSRSQSDFAPYDNIVHEGNKQPMNDQEVEEIPMPMVEATQSANGNSGGGANAATGNGPGDEHVYHNLEPGHINPAFVDGVSLLHCYIKKLIDLPGYPEETTYGVESSENEKSTSTARVSK